MDGADVHAQAPGLTVERVRLPVAPEVPIGNRVLTVVRVDLAHYRLRILTEERHGARRTMPRWLADHHLAGGINAGMFLRNGRSVGYMMQDGRVASNRRVTKYRGVLGFGPRRAGVPALSVTGPRCGGTIDRQARRYENVLQAYRMVDCGTPSNWQSRKRFSAAGFGVDSAGRAVFVHTRTPYRMTVLNRMLADPALGIEGMIYMEGGPEASLVVDDGGVRVSEIGSYEDGFHESDDNHEFWEVPNIVAFERR